MISSYIDAKNAPYVYGQVIIPRLQIAGEVAFLLDTGASVTCLHPYDAREIGVTFDLLRDEAYSSGVGGSASYYRENALIAFEDGSTTSTYDIQLHIASPTTSNRTFPSLLGRDIINRWSVLYEPINAGLNVARLKRTLLCPHLSPLVHRG